MIQFTGERIVPEADNCEPMFAEKMYQEHLARYAFASQWIAGKRVLDVGCGVGYGARWLAENGAESVLAFDLSPDAITHAKEFYSNAKVNYQVASATDFDFGQQFDVVTCFELIEHVDQQQEVLHCIRQALREDGILIISTPRALDEKRTHFHTKEFSELEFRSILQKNFSEVRFFFENNHFSSLIADATPNSIEHIIPLKDQFTIAQADYFIAIASPTLNKEIDSAHPVLVLGNDQYVTLLERDVGILHQAENQLVERLAKETDVLNALKEELLRRDELLSDLSGVLALEKSKAMELNQRLQSEQASFQNQQKEFLDKFTLSQVEAADLVRLIGALEQTVSELNQAKESERRKAQALHSEVSEKLELRQIESVELGLSINVLEQTVEQLKKIGDAKQQKFQELRSELSQKRQTIDQLSSAIDKKNLQLHTHAIALDRAQGDINYLQDVIVQLQSSSSWRLTFPFRRVSGLLKVPVRVLHKVLVYRRQYGNRALALAISRRIRPSETSSTLQLPVTIPATQSAADEFFNVIFAIGCWEGESKRYRVHNLAEGLATLGYTVQVMPFEHIAELADRCIKADVVVLFRGPLSPSMRVDVFLNYAKIRGIKVVFDVDDLVFEPEIIDQIDGVRSLTPEQQQQYLNDTYAYCDLLLAADLVTVPTEYLCTRVKALGQQAFVIPNSINAIQFDIAAELAHEKAKLTDAIRIGYFSGSRTHQADFAECAEALFEVMQSHDNLILRIVGFLELDARWNVFADRIERIDFQPYQTMLHMLNECSINIAPLELKNIFCHGKSELKFFESGLLGIPTIASATDTFKRAIEHNVSGLLCETLDDWRTALEALIESKTLRESIGANAKTVSIERYSYQKAAQIAANIYGLNKARTLSIDTSENRQPVSSDRLRIAWVVPGLIIGGGGHRNILRAAYFLSQFGHQISLYFVGTEQDPYTIKKQIQEHFYPLDCPVYLYEGKIHPADVVFATHWTTVAAALTARDTAREIMYFVQDFEPAFAPMGTEYVLAENTYRLGLYHITSGPWCEVMLRRDFNADADHFQFPVDRSIYYPRERTKANKNLIFFAKPEMPRRCFELGVMALRQFHRLRPDVEIIMFGSKAAGKQHYDFPVTIRDVVPTLDDLAEMYSNGDLGLVFSTTNPSLIPYEMMACGLPVVDLDRGDNAVNYNDRRDIAFLANPLPEKMAEDISFLMGRDDDLAMRRTKGLELVDKFPTEEGMARRIETLIFSRIVNWDTTSHSLLCPACGSKMPLSGRDVIYGCVQCLSCTSMVNMDALASAHRNAGAALELQASSSSDFYQIDEDIFKKTSEEVEKRKDVIRFLIEHYPLVPRDKFVDFGAGYGFSAMAAMEWFENSCAIEIQSDVLSTILDRAGYSGHIPVLSRLEDAGSGFSACFMWHVVEHMPDAFIQLKKIHRMLSPGGCIFAQVPMFRKEYVVSTHFHFLNEDSVRYICGLAGFSEIKVFEDVENSFLTFIAIK